jgi:hypothetical protein
MLRFPKQQCKQPFHISKRITLRVDGVHPHPSSVDHHLTPWPIVPWPRPAPNSHNTNNSNSIKAPKTKSSHNTNNSNPIKEPKKKSTKTRTRTSGFSGFTRPLIRTWNCVPLSSTAQGYSCGYSNNTRTLKGRTWYTLLLDASVRDRLDSKCAMLLMYSI